MTVGFNKEVTLENGIYFNDSFQDEADVEKELSGVQQQEKIYTVGAGDTLWSIAQKNDLTFRELCELNTNFKGAPLNEKSNIQAGDELIVTKQELRWKCASPRWRPGRRRSPIPPRPPPPTSTRWVPRKRCRTV